MFDTLILLLFVKYSIYSMADNNYNIFGDNSEFDAESPDFGSPKPFDMQSSKKVSDKN